MNKVVEEIDQVVGKNKLLQESDIPNLPYLQNTVKETLRLHPAAPLLQKLPTEDCIVGGYHIPANTITFINLWSLGRDPTYWERPLEFRPERFEEKQIDVRGQNFHFLPFGSGKRMCPGVSLGLMFVYTILGSMIQCFTWKAGKYGNLTSVDMEEGTGIALTRANPLVCVPTTRLDLDPLGKQCSTCNNESDTYCGLVERLPSGLDGGRGVIRQLGRGGIRLVLGCLYFPCSASLNLWKHGCKLVAWVGAARGQGLGWSLIGLGLFWAGVWLIRWKPAVAAHFWHLVLLPWLLRCCWS
ncbi:hypothetical protein E3N88_32586 [Mikania micrantha]|uniref:Cytochrome P450 n=1 Tax=Mikania micrantha TaxID=192012 RepID=A0A5N6M9G3_9ASTR|nr:hypothetical protein E3N88_32586 [Mikania micrantha]